MPASRFPMRVPPPLTVAERKAAMDKAAAARRMRVELKEKLKAGSLSLRELLDLSATDEMVARMRVLSALQALPGFGRSKSRQLMGEIGISESRKLKGLGARQRRELLALIGAI